MGKSGIFVMLAALLPIEAVFAAGASDLPPVVNDSASSLLADARCADVNVSNGAEITCFMSFPGAVPNFFYEADSGTNQVIIKLLDTKVGGMLTSGRTDTVNLGPVTTMTVREEIQDKNATVRLLTPELYYVTVVNIACKPMIRRQNDLVVAQDQNTISISFPWPEKIKERKKYYYVVAKKQRRPGVLLALVGVAVAGIAGGGYYAYHYYYLPSLEPVSQPLEPVLPEHPSP